MIYLTEWWDSYDEPGMAVSKSHTHSIYHTTNPKRNQVGSYVRQWIKKKKNPWMRFQVIQRSNKSNNQGISRFPYKVILMN